MSIRTDSSYSHIVKYTGLFGGVQGLSILVGVVRNKLVAVLLGPAGMGLVSLFNSTIKLVSDSTNLGIATSAVRNISEIWERHDDEALRRCVSVIRFWSLLVGVGGMLLCLLLSPWLSRFTFSWNGHTLHFILLSPIVFFMAVTGGELAILKGIRQLRNLALLSLANVVAALVISVPIYWEWGMKGIVPSLVLVAFAQMVLTVGLSYRHCPLRRHIERSYFAEGKPMVKLGVAFVIAGMLGSGADFLIRSYLNNVAQIETVGLYNAGYMMTMTYVGMVFSAMETDYFPRLSGLNHFGVSFNETVNRQSEVMLLLVSPLLVLLMVGLPIFVPLLFSGKFSPVTGMIRVITLAMYLRALKLPVQYIPLAKGDSPSYLFLEGAFDVLLVAGVVGFFRSGGLTGAGWGIALASLADLIITFLWANWRYGYKPSARMLRAALVQLPIGAATYLATVSLRGWSYWLVGTVLVAVSGTATLYILKKTRA